MKTPLILPHNDYSRLVVCVCAARPSAGIGFDRKATSLDPLSFCRDCNKGVYLYVILYPGCPACLTASGASTLPSSKQLMRYRTSKALLFYIIQQYFCIWRARILRGRWHYLRNECLLKDCVGCRCYSYLRSTPARTFSSPWTSSLLYFLAVQVQMQLWWFSSTQTAKQPGCSYPLSQVGISSSPQCRAYLESNSLYLTRWICYWGAGRRYLLRAGQELYLQQGGHDLNACTCHMVSISNCCRCFITTATSH